MPRTRGSKKKQSRLAFSPLSSSSPARVAQPTAIRNRVAAVVVDSPSPARGRGTITPASSSLSVPAKSTTPQRGFMSNSSQLSATRSRRGKPAVVASSSESEAEQDDNALESPDDSESDATPIPSWLQGPTTAASTRTSRKRRSPSFVVGDESEPDVAPARKRQRRQRKQRSPDFIDDAEDSDDVPLPRSSAHQISRRRRTGDSSNESASGEDADDLPVSTPRLKRRPEPKHLELDSADERDLEEDLDFLRSTSPLSTTRLQSPVKNAKQRALDELRKKRARQSSQAPTQVTDDDQEGTSGVQDDDLASEEEGQDEADDYDEDETVADDTFVIDDEDDGDPAAQIPFEFRMAKMKPKELFKFAVEWFVQKKINPAFQSEDEVYRLSFLKLDDYVKGMAGSKYSSSAWTPKFIRAMKARPQLEEMNFAADAMMRDRCDACNRSGHPATWEVRFHGKPYDRGSLEEYSDEEDEDTGISETPLPPERTTFYVGKFCMQKARTNHALTHWRFHLNEWIVDWLDGKGYLKPRKIVERDSWSTRKRNKKAIKIVDKMEREGEIKALYRDFKNESERAQTANEPHFHYSSD